VRRLFAKSSQPQSSGLALAALAPMVDMLTILIVVVLRTYSTDPPLQIEGEPGFVLPRSIEERPSPRGVVIDIADSGIYVEGWRAGSAVYWAQSEEPLIREMYEALHAQKGSRALIRADEETPWSLLGKVLFTVQHAGYEDIELVAESRVSL
jgi:biopolymer transport protein ExbD